MIDLVFEASIAEVMDDHFRDPRLHDALFGGGVIGTWAGPRDPGTASVKLMHHQGNLDGAGSNWAYVEGGMGMVSFAIADAAPRPAPQLACGVPVAAVHPGEGVELEDGTRIQRPQRDLQRRPEGGARPARRGGDRLVRLRLPRAARGLEGAQPGGQVQRGAGRGFRTGPRPAGESWPARAMIELTDGIDAAQAAFERCVAGEPAVGFAEIYTQTGFDPSPAPEGKHLMTASSASTRRTSIADGDWDSRRDDVARQFIDLIGRFAPGFEDLLIDFEVLGPPDVEARIGLTGGQIFQGDVTPEQMWERRLSPRTPIPGFYMCGAATHPGGSVIATNGRNAAAAVVADGVAAGAIG